jgi:hypothetical protein
MSIQVVFGLIVALYSETWPKTGTASTIATRPIVFDHRACEAVSAPNFWVVFEDQVARKDAAPVAPAQESGPRLGLRAFGFTIFAELLGEGRHVGEQHVVRHGPEDREAEGAQAEPRAWCWRCRSSATSRTGSAASRS